MNFEGLLLTILAMLVTGFGGALIALAITGNLKLYFHE